MKEKRMKMKPFVLFTGVKDNPIPYENKYMKAQFKKLRELNEKNQKLKLPVIKEKLKNPQVKIETKNLNSTIQSPFMPNILISP